MRKGVLFGMNDYLRETLSYFGLYKRMFQVKKKYKPESVSFGEHKDQYFLFYEPKRIVSDKVIVWIHGGGWGLSGMPGRIRQTSTPRWAAKARAVSISPSRIR